jgi:hypothetical protein
MQINCYSCHNHFTLRREEVHAALNEMVSEDLSYHNAVCPRCGKANKVSMKQLKRWAPRWEPSSAGEPKEAAKQAEAKEKDSVKGKEK